MVRDEKRRRDGERPEGKLSLKNNDSQDSRHLMVSIESKSYFVQSGVSLSSGEGNYGKDRRDRREWCIQLAEFLRIKLPNSLRAIFDTSRFSRLEPSRESSNPLEDPWTIDHSCNSQALDEFILIDFFSFALEFPDSTHLLGTSFSQRSQIISMAFDYTKSCRIELENCIFSNYQSIET